MKRVWSDIKIEELNVDMTLGGNPDGADENDPLFDAWNLIKDANPSAKRKDYFTQGVLNEAGRSYVTANAGS